MNVIRNFADIDNFYPIAQDLKNLLINPDNHDVAVEFPATISRYTVDLDEVAKNLVEAQESCAEGVRQQFIAFSGENAVGMSVVRYIEDVPKDLDVSGPTLSGFVCNPYRNQGIGRLSLLERLKVVDEQFGGSAWTKVKFDNEFSNRMVTHAGLKKVGIDGDDFIYTYES